MNKILLLCPTPPPYAGPEVATEILINNLPREKSQYVHFKSNLRDENWKKGSLDITGLFKFSVLLTKLIRIFCNNDIKKVYFLLSSGKIGFLRDSVYFLLCILFNKKIILHYRGGNFDGFYSSCSFIFKKVIKLVLKKSDLIIVQAHILKKMFKGITNTRIEVLYNGLPIIYQKHKKIFSKESTTILFLGHISFSKGFYELISVYKSIYKEFKLKLFFAGTFRYEGKKSKTQRAFLNGKSLQYYDNNAGIISSEIKQFILNSEKYNAKYLGIINGLQKDRIFQISDLLVLPSYTEGFSVTVLEALSYGLPVIVSKVGAFPEIIKEDKNGWIVNPGDAEDLKRCIINAINKKNEFENISEYNREYFRNNFDISNIATSFENMISNV